MKKGSSSESSVDVNAEVEIPRPVDNRATDKADEATLLDEMLTPSYGFLGFIATWIAQLIVVTPVFFAVALAYGIDVIGDESESALEELPIAGNMIVFAVSVIASLATVLILMRAKNISLADIRIKKPSAKWMFAVVPMTVVYFLTTAVVFTLLELVVSDDILNTDQVTGFEDASGVFDLGIAFIALVVLAPISEEIVYRGFLLKAWESRIVKPVLAAVAFITSFFIVSQLGLLSDVSIEDATTLVGPAVILLSVAITGFIPSTVYDRLPRSAVLAIGALMVSALFGVAHGQLNVAADTFVLSLFMIVLTIKSDSIVPAILMHAVKNGLAFYFLFIDPELLDTL